jgi:two-component system, LytTR family, sensor kinase
VFSVSYRYVFILLLSVYSYFNIRFTVGDKLFDFSLPGTILFVALTVVVFGVWELNRQTEVKLSTLYEFFKRKIHPLIILFLISLFNVGIVCFVTMELVYMVAELPMQINTTHLTLLMAFGFRVNLFLNCVNAIVYFMNRLKKAELDAEQLKKISIESQFEALRNQINPHFLFNSFNVLSSLVYKDADTSSKFISQLSNVYRYLLYNQDKKIVAVKDELEFIQSYLYLLKIRFEENIVIDNRIDCISDSNFVAPAVLQMLIENAIKHNVVSKKNPLHIELFCANGFIVVQNNLQEKQVKESSTYIGLKNIQARYRLLTDKEVQIEKSGTHFTVRVPILEVLE